MRAGCVQVDVTLLMLNHSSFSLCPSSPWTLSLSLLLYHLLPVAPLCHHALLVLVFSLSHPPPCAFSDHPNVSVSAARDNPISGLSRTNYLGKALRRVRTLI